MKAQGYEISQNIFYQDNQSAIRMEKNGQKSCGEKSRHINIRYFFIKDIIDRENITVEYCPTEEMVADFYTTSHCKVSNFKNFVNSIWELLQTNSNHMRVRSVLKYEHAAQILIHKPEVGKKQRIGAMTNSLQRRETDSIILYE